MHHFYDRLSMIFKKSFPDGFFQGVTDINTHILPEADDGVQDMKEMIDIIRLFESVGVKRMVLSPHFRTEFSHNRKTSITEEFEQAVRTLKTGLIKDMELEVAAEYLIDEDFMSHKQDGWMTIGKENRHILVETTFLTHNPLFDKGLAELQSERYNVILTHPERYVYCDMNIYKEWKKKNCLFQLNILSLSGFYGKEIKDSAERLLDAGMYDFVASDVHRIDSFVDWFKMLRLKPKHVDLIHKLLENNETLY